MQVPMTAQMLDALREAPEIPDNLLARVDGAQVSGEGFVLELAYEEALAMTEMCEWHVRKDPATGQLTESGKTYDSIIEAINDATMS